jgi:hypothetical protein
MDWPASEPKRVILAKGEDILIAGEDGYRASGVAVHMVCRTPRGPPMRLASSKNNLRVSLARCGRIAG